MLQVLFLALYCEAVSFMHFSVSYSEKSLFCYLPDVKIVYAITVVHDGYYDIR